MVPNRALCIGPAENQRDAVHVGDFASDIRPAQYESDLWSIAMGDYDVVSLLDDACDMLGSSADGIVLVFHGFVGLIANERISTDRDNCQFSQNYLPPINRVITAFAV